MCSRISLSAAFEYGIVRAFEYVIVRDLTFGRLTQRLTKTLQRYASYLEAACIVMCTT